METSQSAGAVAPRPTLLPVHTIGFVNAPVLAVSALPPEEDATQGTVMLWTGAGAVGISPRWLTPAEARLLAVYLVDCANALDNPAQRVIVDDQVGEGIGHE